MANVNYKVALVKLLYRNTINNVGSIGANTRFFVSNGKTYDNVEINIPELQLTSLGQIVTVLKVELKRVLRDYVRDVTANKREPVISISAVSANEIAKTIDAIPVSTKLDYIIENPWAKYHRGEVTDLPADEPYDDDDDENLDERGPFSSTEEASFMIDELNRINELSMQRDEGEAEALMRVEVGRIHDFFDEVETYYWGKLFEILLDPFLKTAERIVLWNDTFNALNNDEDRGATFLSIAKGHETLWEEKYKTKLGKYPYTHHVRVLEKFDFLNQSFVSFVQRANLFDSEQASIWRSFGTSIKAEMDRLDILFTFDRIAEKIRTDKPAETRFMTDELPSSPVFTLFHFYKIISADPDATDEESTELKRQTLKDAFEAYNDLLNSIDTCGEYLKSEWKFETKLPPLYVEVAKKFFSLMKIKLYLEENYITKLQAEEVSDERIDAARTKHRKFKKVKFQTDKE